MGRVVNPGKTCILLNKVLLVTFKIMMTLATKLNPICKITLVQLNIFVFLYMNNKRIEARNV